MASRTQSRKSVATWSLRLRAVCSRSPASPMRSDSRASMFMWMSSRATSKLKVPASISPAIRCRPARIACSSAASMMPVRASMAACASDPLMSCRHSARSKPIEALISCMIADGPPAKRPPHWAFALSVGPAPGFPCLSPASKDMHMPLIKPIVMRRGLLAAGGTLLAALVARNSLRQPAPAGQGAPGSGPVPDTAPAAAGPAPRAISDLRPHAPAALPVLAFTTADGARRTLFDYAGRKASS